MLGSYTSANTAESALVKTGPGGVHTLTLAAGSDTATLIIYDNTEGSGTILCKLSAVANTTAHTRLDAPFSAGCYAAVTGTAPSATVTYW